MIYKKRISISLLSGLIVEILNKIAPLIIIHVAQKRLGIEKLGYALFGVSVIELVTPLIVFGYNQYGVIAAGQQPKLTSKLMSGSLVLKLLHFVLLLGCLYLFFSYVPTYKTYFPLMMTLSILLFFSAFDVLWVQTASQKVSISNLFVGFCRLLTLILILIFIKDANDAILFAFLSLVGNALVNVLSSMYSIRKFGLERPDVAFMKKIFRASYPYALIGILGIIGERMDILFAERFGGLAGAGYYACCARLSHSLTQIANTIISAFFSEMVIIKDSESLYKHLRLGTWTLLFFLSPIIFGVWFVSGEILTFIFDSSFRSIKTVLGWLFLSTSFTLLASSLGQQVLLLSGKVHTYTKALASGIFLSSILIYLFGGSNLYAIAIAMCIGKFFTLLIVLYAVHRNSIHIPLSIFFKTLMPGLVMCIVLLIFDFKSFFLNIGVGAVIFFIFAYLLNRQEFHYIVSLFLKAHRSQKNPFSS